MIKTHGVWDPVYAGQLVTRTNLLEFISWTLLVAATNTAGGLLQAWSYSAQCQNLIYGATQQTASVAS